MGTQENPAINDRRDVLIGSRLCYLSDILEVQMVKCIRFKITFAAMILVVLATAAAAQTKVGVYSLKSGGAGRIMLRAKSLSATIDLKKEVFGCPYVAPKYRANLTKLGCAASPAEFKLLDGRAKSGRHYILISSEAMGNCNVCGRCGASESVSLIWLVLDRRMKVLQRKSVAVEHCADNVSLKSPEFDFAEGGDQIFEWKFDGDILRAEFETTVYGDESADVSVSSLEYSRLAPEKGLVIKTEKRKK